jgi:chromate transport protein ChrA
MISIFIYNFISYFPIIIVQGINRINHLFRCSNEKEDIYANRYIAIAYLVHAISWSLIRESSWIFWITLCIYTLFNIEKRLRIISTNTYCLLCLLYLFIVIEAYVIYTETNSVKGFYLSLIQLRYLRHFNLNLHLCDD